MRTFIRSNLLLSMALFGGTLLLAPLASAQQPARKPAQPAVLPAPAAAPQAPAAGVAPTPGTPPPVDRIPVELTQTSPSGLTADQVGARAAQTSYQAKASQETLNAAAARVDAAWAQFLPRLTALGRYTRLSEFTPPSFSTGVPGQPPLTFALPPVNQWLLQAGITIPISDYFLKINQNYSAATRAESAARYDVGAARAKSHADGRVAYYNWLRNRNAVVVAVLALADQRNHLTDASNQFQVGNASRADVLRAETNVAAAELQVERAKNLADLSEKQVRIAMHAPEGEQLLPGEGLDTAPSEFQGNLRALTDEGLANRLEIKSIEANAEAARKQAKAANAAAYPALTGFGDLIHANPNPRYFPQTQDWRTTWQVGAQIIWSPNDILTGSANSADFESRAAALEAQRWVTRDGIEVEVLQAWQQIKEADVAMESTKRQLASSSEAYRVARELFNAGRGTSTTLTDAETELTRSRLAELNAKTDARIARVRLEHAVGRDTKDAARNP